MKKIMITIIIFMFMSGCITRSKLIDSEKVPTVCKIYLECLYMNKENKDKSVCTAMADSCDKVIIYETCHGKYPDKASYQKLQNCVNTLN